MVEQALDTFGGLHAVINPAGILRDGMFHKMSEQDWDRVIEVHLKGSFNVARATIEHFREQNDGAYVFFTSTSGLLGNIGQTNYGAAKMGIAGLSRIIAMEGGRNNVRANCLAPVAWTRMTQSVPVRGARRWPRPSVPTSRRGSRWRWSPRRPSTSPARSSAPAVRTSSSTASRGRSRP
jgi:NAD(P)-dependent dehydrogenase (short-subunit alcohol dehydrogenase family)